MPAHRFNPVSALIGIALIALGAAVAVFGFDAIDNDPATWGGAAIAVLIAFVLLAIPTRQQPTPDDA
jgi:peptidoglycan/LPS O-acetylase OafA/YrhL